MNTKLCAVFAHYVLQEKLYLYTVQARVNILKKSNEVKYGGSSQVDVR